MIIMKKLFLILFVISAFNLNAQYITKHAKNLKKDINEEGIFYYLPQNIIRIDFEVEQTKNIKGKYCNYAKEVLSTDDYIKDNKTHYSIKKINISTLTETDPNMLFFVKVDEKTKENPSINFNITNDGIIKSFGYDNADFNSFDNESYSHELVSEIQSNDYHYIPMIEEDDEDEFFSDEVENDDVEEKQDVKEKTISEEEIVQSIIEEIKKIRIAYLDLISGYQEVNYGTTINYMVEELVGLEKEYLSMFVGKTISNRFTKTFYIVPSKDNNNVVISKFSDTEGFNSKNGDLIKINFSKYSDNISYNHLTNDAATTEEFTNKLIYRTPANVSVKISIGDKVVLNDKLIISQLGNLVAIPMNKMKITFDTNTGQVTSIVKE